MDDGETLMFRVGPEVYEYDWHYLMEEIEDLGNWSREYFASCLWLGFLLEHALGQPRPWDDSLLRVVRLMAICWRGAGPAHLAATDTGDVVDSWS